MNKAILLDSHADMRDDVANPDQNFPPRPRTALGVVPSNQEMLNAGTGVLAPSNREEASIMQSHHAHTPGSVFGGVPGSPASNRMFEFALFGALGGAVIGAAATIVTAAGATFAVPGMDFVIEGTGMVAMAGAVAGALTGGIVGAILGSLMSTAPKA